jgi:hypothetical protein
LGIAKYSADFSTLPSVKLSFACFAIIAAIFISCAIEDPSVADFDLHRILLKGNAPFEVYFSEPESYTYANKQADLFYIMDNGDTMRVSVCEFENATLAKAFFYNSGGIVEREEYLIDGYRKKFLRWGRRLFIFSYQFSISHNSSTLDSLHSFIKKFPAADTSANMDIKSFSLKNSHPTEDISIQRNNFFGIEAPFNMFVRRYREAGFTWFCAHSSNTVSLQDWENYKAKWHKNVYGSDSTAIISRLPNGIVATVYGELDKERKRNIFKEFAERVKN